MTNILHIVEREGSIYEAFKDGDQRDRMLLTLLSELDKKLPFPVWAYKSHRRLVLSNSKVGGEAVMVQVAAIEDMYNIGSILPQPLRSIPHEATVAYNMREPGRAAEVVVELARIWLEENGSGHH